MDDDADCVEHVWQLRTAVLDRSADVEYSCIRCGTITVRTAGQPFPG